MATMNLTVSGIEEFDKMLKIMGDNRRTGKVIRKSWSASIRDDIRPGVRRHVRTSFRGKKKLASSYSARVIGGSTPNMMQMIVYSRLKMSMPFEFGGAKYPITPVKGQYLAIPTKAATQTRIPANSLKGMSSRTRRIRMKNLPPSKTFITREKEGKRWVVMKVDQDTQSSVRKMQIKSLRGTKHGGINKVDGIPLFLLVKEVELKKKTQVRWVFSRFVRPTSLRAAKNLKEEFLKYYKPIGAAM